MSATQPITLVTATPGGGKTALSVMLMKKATDEGRPLFVSGIPELKLPYIPTPPIAEWTEQREDPENPGVFMPYFTFPAKSLIVIDEAQRIFRPRATGSKVPDHIAAFETVRHTGVTFLLITQNPAFLDAHIRKLVGQHVHLRDAGLLGRWYYEWPECANVETFNTAPIKKKWALPKESFGLYKSSSMHIKRKYTIPPVMLLLFACLAIALVVGWRLFGSIDQKINPGGTTPQVEAKNAPVGSPVASQAPPPLPAAARGGVASSDGAEYLAAFVPAAPGHPESAPAYAELRQVKVMPVVIGGACNARVCRCYTQQGTDAGLDDRQCRDWLRKPPFNPYQEQAPAAIEATRSGDVAPGGPKA